MGSFCLSEERFPSVGFAALTFLLILIHGLLWAWLVPLWQAPDEPGHYEYARLLASLGRRPRSVDVSPALQREIILSLANHDFWRWLGELTPDPLPKTFAQATDPFLSRAGMQVTDEPPLYYLVPAMVCRWVPDVDVQVRWLRAYSALLSAGVVVFVYLAVTEVFPSAPELAVVAVAFVGFLPMFAFIGSSINNDSLVNLIAAAGFWAIARGTRRGWNVWRVTGLLLLATLAPLAKKSGLFLMPLALLALVWSPLARWSPRRRVAMAAGLLGLLLASTQLRVHDQPAAWARRGTLRYAARTQAAAHSGLWALTLPPVRTPAEAYLVQSLPHSQVVELRGQGVRFQVWARTDVEQAGVQVAILGNGLQQRRRFTVTHMWTSLVVTARVPSDAERLRVWLAPMGDAKSPATRLYFDDASLRAQTGKLAGQELLQNGSAEEAKQVIAIWAATYLRLPLWFWQGVTDPASYTLDALARYGLYVALTFVGFWGNFGWLTMPLPVWVYVLLALACGLALTGVLLFVSRLWKALSSQQRRLLVLFTLGVGLIAAQTFLPMIGRQWQPQGRYLFTALTPLALGWALSWREWGHRLRRREWPMVPIAFMVILDIGVLLGMIIPFYAQV
ncbi:MAG TPA: DUF2142 domain-containing protein [Anaerolineae bacterium]|nr:DUF2142 domain-containing protein [Anaerolineae bacterium]